eukprot:4555602-Pyramimonas_sp.AAC.1
MQTKCQHRDVRRDKHISAHEPIRLLLGKDSTICSYEYSSYEYRLSYLRGHGPCAGCAEFGLTPRCGRCP